MCKAHFIYDENRQRSLQHLIQIEELPDYFKTVHLPSGELTEMFRVSQRNLISLFAGVYSAAGFQVKLQRKQMQFLVQVTPDTVSSHLSGVCRSICPASCS